MARDILAIPAAGVGLERQFSDARQMGKFNRQYNQATFQAIMELRYFYQMENRLLQRDIDDEQLLLDREIGQTCPDYLRERAQKELQRRRQELNDVLLLNYISDEEEGDEDNRDVDGGIDEGVDGERTVFNYATPRRPALTPRRNQRMAPPSSIRARGKASNLQRSVLGRHTRSQSSLVPETPTKRMRTS